MTTISYKLWDFGYEVVGYQKRTETVKDNRKKNNLEHLVIILIRISLFHLLRLTFFFRFSIIIVLLNFCNSMRTSFFFAFDSAFFISVKISVEDDNDNNKNNNELVGLPLEELFNNHSLDAIAFFFALR